MTLLDQLIEIRKQQRVKQYKVAEFIGVNRSTMSRYEKKIREISIDHLIMYAEYLGYELRLLKKCKHLF